MPVDTLNIVRWKNWSTSKVPLFFVCMYYAALSRVPLETAAIGEMAGLVLILCLYAAFGYTVNSYSDREVDRAAGKQNKLDEMSEGWAMTSLGLIVLASVVAALSLYWGRIDVLSLLACAYALAAFYSLPPIRFKERGLLGWVASAIAQRTLPAIIIFVAMDCWDWTAFALCALSTLIGIRYIAVHQIQDEAGDRRSGVRTIATTEGPTFVERAINDDIFPVERMTLVITLLLMAYLNPLILLAVLSYAIWFYIKHAVLPEKNASLYSHQGLRDFYYFYWPLTLSILMVIENPDFWVVTAFTLIWCHRVFRQESYNALVVGTKLFTRGFRRI